MYQVFAPQHGKPSDPLEHVTTTDNKSLAIYCSQLPGWVVIVGGIG